MCYKSKETQGKASHEALPLVDALQCRTAFQYTRVALHPRSSCGDAA